MFIPPIIHHEINGFQYESILFNLLSKGKIFLYETPNPISLSFCTKAVPNPLNFNHFNKKAPRKITGAFSILISMINYFSTIGSHSPSFSIFNLTGPSACHDSDEL